MERDEYVVVVEPTAPEDAERRFEDWLSNTPGLREILKPEDILRDLMWCGPGRGCKTRIRVRRAALSAEE
jgi:hypothetical protein